MPTSNPLAAKRVSDAMTRHVQTVMIDDSIQDAASLMLDHELTTIPVVSAQETCVGMISRSDLTELFLKEDHVLAGVLDSDRFSQDWFQRSIETCEVRQVKELMNPEVTQIRESQSLLAACQLMARKRIHHLPVVGEENQVVGILSAFDIVKAVADA